MKVTLDIGYILIGVIMFTVLCAKIYAQGRVDENRNQTINLPALKKLCLIYYTIARDAIGERALEHRVSAKVNEMEKELAKSLK